METRESGSQLWRFGIFEVDTRRSELRREGIPVKLREQSFRVLVLLLESAGDIVTREELRKGLWASDTWVDFDHSLNTAVMKLRDALGDSAETPLYIETIPKRGYRFVAPVNMPDSDEPARPGPIQQTEQKHPFRLGWSRSAVQVCIWGCAVLLLITVLAAAWWQYDHHRPSQNARVPSQIQHSSELLSVRGSMTTLEVAMNGDFWMRHMLAIGNISQ